MATNGDPQINLRHLQDRLDALANLVYRLTIEVGTLNATAIGLLDGTLTEKKRAEAHANVNETVESIMEEIEETKKETNGE